MPELPEVENVIRTMAGYVLGRHAVEIVYSAPHLQVFPFGYTEEQCWLDKKMTALKRHGKYIQLFFADDSAFVIHLRMTGKIFFEDEPRPGKHVHLIIRLSSGENSSENSGQHNRMNNKKYLHFSDVRKFARFIFIPPGTDIKKFIAAGPDALSVSDREIEKACRKWPKAKVKTFLLDQKRIAGIGNIYADEICHRIGCVPDRLLGRVDPRRLAAAIREILADAIRQKGTTLRDYRDAEGSSGSFQNTLKVYGQDKCADCGKQTVKIKLAGRTTRFCPYCQE